MPDDLPPWLVVYQKTQRWIRARCFETLVEDLHMLHREFAGRRAQQTVMILDSRTLQSTPESLTAAISVRYIMVWPVSAWLARAEGGGVDGRSAEVADGDGRRWTGRVYWTSSQDGGGAGWADRNGGWSVLAIG